MTGRSKITDVPCRVCGAESGQPCTAPSGKVALAGWHGGRVQDAADARVMDERLQPAPDPFEVP